MLTVDFDRLGLRPGDRVLDMGCGAGRHAFEMYKRGADVIAFDQDADELATVREWFAAMREAGEVPEGAEADVKESMVRAARRRIVLADSSKVGEVHLHRFARLDDLDLVITDEDLDEDHLAELRTDDGPEVVLA